MGPPMSEPVDNARRPVIVCQPRRRWLEVNWRELWAYRGLWGMLALRDIKVRYKQTLLGGLWAILQPLAAMAIFTVVFSRFVGLRTDGIPAPVFYYAGLLPWTFFAAAVTGASRSVVEGSRLITKVYFPRILIPTSVLGYTLLDFALGAIVFVPLMGWYGVGPGASIVALPVILAGVVLASLGVGVLIAALNVKYRDIRYVAPFLVQLWLFATPVIYPASVIPRRIAWLVDLNPMAGLIENFRACLLNRPLHAESLLISLAAGVVFFGVGFAYFRHVEDGFADIL